MSKLKNWTSDELAKLRKLAPKSNTWDELALNFQDRTAKAVKFQCMKYKIQKKRQVSVWSDGEIRKLKSLNSRCKTWKEVALSFPNRTVAAVAKEGRKNNIKVITQFIEWTQDELAKLRELAKTEQTFKELALNFPNRTVMSIEGQCRKHGFKQKQSYSNWTEEEIDLLKEVYPKCKEVRDIVPLFNSRTYSSIWKKAKLLNIKQEVDYHFWTEENIKILEKFYPTSTQEELEKIFPNMTYEQIVGKAYSLKTNKTTEYRSEAQQGENNHFYGNKHTEETIEHLKGIWDERKQDPDWVHCWVGREHKEESKRNMSVGHKDWYKENEHPMKGKEHSEQSKQNMRIPHEMSEEGSQAIRESVMSRPHFRKIAYELDDKVIYLDSSYEVKFVDALIKHNYRWKRNTTESVIYKDEYDKERHFFFDFIVWRGDVEYIVEIKGEHLLCDDFEMGGQKCYTVRKCRSAVKKYGDRFVLLALDGVEEFMDTGLWSKHQIDMASFLT